MEVAELFAKGGPVMYLLLISSVTVAAIGIERYFFIFAKGEFQETTTGRSFDFLQQRKFLRWACGGGWRQSGGCGRKR